MGVLGPVGVRGFRALGFWAAGWGFWDRRFRVQGSGFVASEWPSGSSLRQGAVHICLGSKGLIAIIAQVG